MVAAHLGLRADDRILWGGYDAIYHFGRGIRAAYDQRPATFTTLAAHFFSTFPQLEGIRFSHRWGGVIDTCSRFCAFFGTAHRGRVAYALIYLAGIQWLRTLSWLVSVVGLVLIFLQLVR